MTEKINKAGVSRLAAYQQMVDVAQMMADQLVERFGSIEEARSQARKEIHACGYSHRPSVLFNRLLWITAHHLLTAEATGEDYEAYELELDFRHSQRMKDLREGGTTL